jgi:hypothetical protein
MSGSASGVWCVLQDVRYFADDGRDEEGFCECGYE